MMRPPRFVLAALAACLPLASAVSCRSPSTVDARAESQASGRATGTAGRGGVSPVPPRGAAGAAGSTTSPQATARAAVLDPRIYDASAPPSSESAVAAASAATDPTHREPRTRRYVVAAMGDSLTDPKSHGGRYLKVLAERCPESRFVSRGKGGEMVNQMRRRFSRDVLNDPTPPDGLEYTDVIVFGGVNDLYSDETAGRTVEKIEHDLASMYAAAKGAGLRVTAITVTPWGGFDRYYNARRGAATLRLNAWILGRAKSGRIDHAVDAYPLLSCGRREYLCQEYSKPFKDGLHFGKEGHERLGAALFETAFSDCR